MEVFINKKAYTANEDETVIAVNGLIGPSSRFKLPIKQAKTERQKKEAKINYDYHKRLHDMMVDFLLEGGEIGMSAGVHIDPHIIHYMREIHKITYHNYQRIEPILKHQRNLFSIRKNHLLQILLNAA